MQILGKKQSIAPQSSQFLTLTLDREISNFKFNFEYVINIAKTNSRCQNTLK